MNQDFSIRDLHQSDIAYIYASWLRHYKHSSKFAHKIPPSIFFSNHNDVIRKILARPTTKVLIASPHEEPEVVLGYLVFEGKIDKPTVHFLYVKRHFRLFGIAATLIKDLNLNTASFTHWTRDTDWIVKRFSSLRYNPYAIGEISG